VFEKMKITEPNQLFEKLISKMRGYHPSSDYELVERAFEVASAAHAHQFRKSGEAYILHPLEVAIILAELELDRETIAAGILHDVIEDCPDYPFERIRELFGAEVANLVDGVTKLQQIKVNTEFKKNLNKGKNRAHRHTSKEEEQAENYRKLFISTAKDIRVVLIKLADRLHNLSTLDAMSEEKRKRIATESLDIYAPLAGRLGISSMRRRIEDLAFKYYDRETYTYIKEKVNMKVDARQKHMEKIEFEIHMLLKTEGVKGKVKGRAKHFFSIHKKIKKNGGNIDEVMDLFAVRIIVDTEAECWQALGLVTNAYAPMPGRHKNYIARPKPNGYQSLHDVLIDPEGGWPFEVQIRTHEMHKVAESGVAAHWKYKEGSTGQMEGDLKLAWLAQILELQRENEDNEDFMPLLKGELDVYNSFVHCYTPQGHVIALPHGATPIDFAYAVHSAVGNKLTGAKVFGNMVTKEYVLKDGDHVEIVTNAGAKGPNAEWLKIAKTSQAKNKIKQWLKGADREASIAKGKSLLDAAAAEKGKELSLQRLHTPEGEKIVLKRHSIKDFDTLTAAIGRGAISERSVINRLYDEYMRQNPALEPTAEEILVEINKDQKHPQREIAHSGDVIVQGASGLQIEYSKCCSPVPGDDIIAFATRSRGATIHRAVCINILNLPESEHPRLLEAMWNIGETDNKHFFAELKIYCDSAGMIPQVSDVFLKASMEIKAMDYKQTGDGAIFSAVIPVSSRDDVEKICNRLTALRGVHSVERIMT